MRKRFWIWTLLLLLTACGQTEAAESSLILTNYAPEVIANISVSCGGEVAAESEAGIVDTQFCTFAMPEGDFVYTVSFETLEGQTVSETFTDRFSAGNAVYLRADLKDGSWKLNYDRNA